ncbi:RING-H2 finger protein, partial [bacterium]|nr:RING-H2 finger protein [Candidatus Elulimicrobium humile]
YTEPHLPDYLDRLNNSDITEDTSCSICFETIYPGNEQPELYTIRNCKHIFHQQCILKWFKTPKVVNADETIPTTNSCPICRQSIIFCETCKGTTVVKETFFGSVPPYDPESDQDRIETDGPYGIHTIYYEELYFKGVLYDRIHNTISLLPLEEVNDNNNEQ